MEQCGLLLCSLCGQFRRTSGRWELHPLSLPRSWQIRIASEQAATWYTPLRSASGWAAWVIHPVLLVTLGCAAQKLSGTSSFVAISKRSLLKRGHA